LTGGGDRHYAFGLATALVSRGVNVDFVGGDEVDSPEMHRTPGLEFHNLRRNAQRDVTFVEKALRLLVYYVRLMWYVAVARPKLVHVLWNSKIEHFDRTLLMLYYKLLRKKVALTAHNVNSGVRDSTDSCLNRLTLKIQYRLSDHIFVHTERMADELRESFGVPRPRVSVICHGVNTAVPQTRLTIDGAKQRLGIRPDERTILFFGNIAPYKGLEYLLDAFEKVVAAGGDYRLIVAGREKEGCKAYVQEIRRSLDRPAIRERAIQRIEFVPDDDIELYFKAADVSVLPYTHIFQSGVLFLGYAFGLPVIAADVGSLREDIVEGETGFLFKPRDSVELAVAIEKYFGGSLYERLDEVRPQIREYASQRNSWEATADATCEAYVRMLSGERS